MISIVIPTYNRGKVIINAIKSVLNQTYDNIEIIIIDDCSTDNTEEVVKSVESEKIIYVKLEKNSGACVARNKGIEIARGEYIAFLDSDDTWEKNKLERQVEYIEKNKVKVNVTNFFYKKGEEKRLVIDKNHNSIISLEELLYSNIVTTGCIIAEKSLLENVGMFDKTLPRYQDWDLIIRLARKTEIYLLNEPLLTLNFEENSITNNITMDKRNKSLYTIFKKNEDIFDEYPEAKAHICWMIGLTSLYTNKTNKKMLKMGLKTKKIKAKIKRIIIYLCVSFGFKRIIMKMYTKKNLLK